MRTEVDQESFNLWCAALDAYLEAVGVATRVYHFRLPALLFGYVTEMNPESFVQDGWDRDVTELSVWSEDVNQLSLRSYLDTAKSVTTSTKGGDDQPPKPHYNRCPVCGASDWCVGEIFAGQIIRFKRRTAGFLEPNLFVSAYGCRQCGHIALASHELINRAKNGDY